MLFYPSCDTRSNARLREGRFSHSSPSQYYSTRCHITLSRPLVRPSSQVLHFHTSGSRESSPSNHCSLTLLRSSSLQVRCQRSMNRERLSFCCQSLLKETTISPENFSADTPSSSQFSPSTSFSASLRPSHSSGHSSDSKSSPACFWSKLLPRGSSTPSRSCLENSSDDPHSPTSSPQLFSFPAS